ncbi:MAG TPA: terminase family protein [Armatimonadota bacterium]|jgi:phage FluMu gp28-like protein
MYERSPTPAEGYWRELLEGGALADGVRLEPYQVRFLEDGALRRVVLKSRQVGFSWLFALEAMLAAHARDGAFSIFVSLNREEAQEKIRYALEVHDLLPPGWRRRVLHASRTEIELEGGGRLLSHPCRAPRGRSGADLYLDELAFYRDDEEVYQGALPVISRGGRIVLASTPFGERGVFWRQATGDSGPSLPGHHPEGEKATAAAASHHRVPWWRCSWLRNGEEPGPQVEELDTPLRVDRFGADRLQVIYAAMDLQSFQQEYECRFVDAAASWLPYEQLLPCVHEDLAVAETVADLSEIGPLYAGYDVGRVNHASELLVLVPQPSGYRLCLCQTLRGAEFQLQRELLTDLLSRFPRCRLCLDATGLGANLAEDLRREFRLRVEPVTFTAPVKETLANGLKLAVEGGRLSIPPTRDLITQLHSVRRIITTTGSSRFDAEGRAGHHADKFWALALALWAAEAPAPRVRARRL